MWRVHYQLKKWSDLISYIITPIKLKTKIKIKIKITIDDQN